MATHNPLRRTIQEHNRRIANQTNGHGELASIASTEGSCSNILVLLEVHLPNLASHDLRNLPMRE